MVEMKNFVFYGVPIKIETEKWRMEFTPVDDDISTIEITKEYCWGRTIWAFRIIERDWELESYPTICASDDPIARCIRHLKECSDQHKLNWSAVDSTFLSIITYLNE